MKTYKRHITIDELRARCAAAGVPLNSHLYDTKGHDHVVVGEGPNKVYCSSFNGSFFGWRGGNLDEDSHFDSRSNLEHEPWFAALLDFFYTNEDLPK